MDITLIASAPWDFTLYESNYGTLILKVIFSEGAYKTDVGRYFEVDHLDIDRTDVEGSKKLASRIRAECPNARFNEIAATDLRN